MPIVSRPSTPREYALAIAGGELPAGKYHRLACQRFLRDLDRAGSDDFPYIYQARLAERFTSFASKLAHYKGKPWAGEPIRLSLSQQFRLGQIHGWVHMRTGMRRFRTSYNELPRKNGKSLEAAVVVIYFSFFDGEPGAEGYCTATKREQAAIVFGDAIRLVKNNRALAKRIAVHARSLSRRANKVQPLSKDTGGMDGLNPHIVIVDEFHAHKDRGIIDVMETALGARSQPVMFQITTAGDNPVSPCGDQHDYACKILDGTLVDETFFAFIAHADEKDDWLDERTWRKANPHYGISVNPTDMASLALKARSIPSAAAAFKQKRLNLWVNASAPCLSMEGWSAGQSKLTPEEWEARLRGRQCFVGVDLASKIDLVACSFVFPPAGAERRWSLLQRIWTPKDTLRDRARRDRAPYEQWVSEGWLIAPGGSIVDHELVREAILWGRGIFDIQMVGFDPWHASQLATKLVNADGFDEEKIVGIPQTYAGISAAETDFKAFVLDAAIDANSCPVTRWAASNVVEMTDGKNNIQFTKKRSRGRIDPIKSATTALACWKREQPAEKEFQVIIMGGQQAR